MPQCLSSSVLFYLDKVTEHFKDSKSPLICHFIFSLNNNNKSLYLMNSRTACKETARLHAARDLLMGFAAGCKICHQVGYPKTNLNIREAFPRGNWLMSDEKNVEWHKSQLLSSEWETVTDLAKKK